MKRWKKIALAAAGCLAGAGVLFLAWFYVAFQNADMSGVEEIRRAAGEDLARVAREVELGRTTETLKGAVVVHTEGPTSNALEVTDRRSVDFFRELSRLDSAYRNLRGERWLKPVHNRLRYVLGQFEMEKVEDPLRGKDTGGKPVWVSVQEGPRRMEAMERFFRWKEARDEAEGDLEFKKTNRGIPTADSVLAAHRLLDEVEEFLLRAEWRVETREEIGPATAASIRNIEWTMLCVARACREGNETKARLLYLRAIDMVRILTATPTLRGARVNVLGLSVVYAGESRNAAAGLREGARRMEGFRLTQEQSKLRFLADLRQQGEVSIRWYVENTHYGPGFVSQLNQKLGQLIVVVPVRALHARALEAIEREDAREFNELKKQASVFGQLFDGRLDSIFRRLEATPVDVHPEWKKILRLDTVFSRFKDNEETDRGQAVLACLAYRAEHGNWPGSMREAERAVDGLKRDGDVEWRPVVFEGFRYPLINRFGADNDNGPKLDPFSKAVQAFVDEHGRVPTEAAELRNIPGRTYFDESVARERFENFPGFWALVEIRRGQFQQTELGKIMVERQRDLGAPPTAEELARLYGTDERRETVTIEGIAISKRGTGIEDGDWLIRNPSRRGGEKHE